MNIINQKQEAKSFEDMGSTEKFLRTVFGAVLAVVIMAMLELCRKEIGQYDFTAQAMMAWYFFDLYIAWYIFNLVRGKKL